MFSVPIIQFPVLLLFSCIFDSLALVSKVEDPQDRVHDVETVEEKKQKAEGKWSTYQKRISKAYNKQVKPRLFKVGDLVLKAAGHVKKGMNASKFTFKWEGPYVI